MQVEEVRNPTLRGRPVGVTQKYLVVTSNYEARHRGVSKLMGIQDAINKCPELVLVRPDAWLVNTCWENTRSPAVLHPCSRACVMQVPGEDLTPYRKASKAMWAMLQPYGPVQRGGLDEAFVDVTAEVCTCCRIA